MSCQAIYEAIETADIAAYQTLQSILAGEAVTVQSQTDLYNVGRDVCTAMGQSDSCLIDCLFKEKQSAGLYHDATGQGPSAGYAQTMGLEEKTVSQLKPNLINELSQSTSKAMQTVTGDLKKGALFGLPLLGVGLVAGIVLLVWLKPWRL